MGLVKGKELIQECVNRGVVAGAFNTTNLETTLGIIAAVEQTGVPTFIQVAPTTSPSPVTTTSRKWFDGEPSPPLFNCFAFGSRAYSRRRRRRAGSKLHLHHARCLGIRL